MPTPTEYKEPLRHWEISFRGIVNTSRIVLSSDQSSYTDYYGAKKSAGVRNSPHLSTCTPPTLEVCWFYSPTLRFCSVFRCVRFLLAHVLYPHCVGSVMPRPALPSFPPSPRFLLFHFHFIPCFLFFIFCPYFHPAFPFVYLGIRGWSFMCLHTDFSWFWQLVILTTFSFSFLNYIRWSHSMDHWNTCRGIWVAQRQTSRHAIFN